MTSPTRVRMLSMLALSLTACTDRSSPLLSPTPRVTQVTPVTCTVLAATKTASCNAGLSVTNASRTAAVRQARTTLQTMSAPEPGGFIAHAVLGGAQVAFDVYDVHTVSGTVNFQTRISNLLDQPLGWAGVGGLAVDGVRVFVESGVVGIPLGNAALVNADGQATLSAPDQDYLSYGPQIESNGSATRTWQVELTAGATGFTFQALVVAELADESTTRVSAAGISISAISMARNVQFEASTCALSEYGNPWCWGTSYTGNPIGFLEDGIPTGTVRATPVEQAWATTTVVMDADPNNASIATCGIRGDGAVTCRGRLDRFGIALSGGDRPSVIPSPVAFRTLVLGASFMCALDATGSESGTGAVWCIGTSPEGALGTPGVTQSVDKWNRVDFPVPFKRISAGQKHMCALGTNNRVYCWGDNSRRQLGDGTAVATRPRPVPILDALSSTGAYTQLATGSMHSCAIDDDGQSFCWGDNSFYQTGATNDFDLVERPSAVQTGQVFVALFAGFYGSCGITFGQALWCWGTNDYGQLGLTPGEPSRSYVPVRVSTKQFTDVSIGSSTMCGIVTDDGGVPECWGDNTKGALGRGDAFVENFDTLPAPVVLPSGQNWRGAVVSTSFACSWTQTNRVWCWGDNGQAQPMISARRSGVVRTPVGLRTSIRFRGMAQSFGAACGVSLQGPMEEGRFYCWGALSPAFGGGNANAPISEIPIPGADPVTQVVAGLAHVCTLGQSGNAYCFGDNASGQLGTDSATHPSRSLPATVYGNHVFRNIAASDFATCGVTTSRTVYCWGDGFRGMLGNGNSDDRWFPVLVAGISADTVVMGGFHTCALDKSKGEVKCWGQRLYGKLGDPTLADLGNGNGYEYSPPTNAVPTGGIKLTQITAGGDGTCAVTEANALMCWGWLATGDQDTQYVGYERYLHPTVIPTPFGVRSVTTTGYGTCVITVDSDLRCTGFDPGIADVNNNIGGWARPSLPQGRGRVAGPGG